MRVSPVGFLADSEAQVIEWADFVTGVTHDHPEAITSARAVALAIFWAKNKVPTEKIGLWIGTQFCYDLSVPIDIIRTNYVRTERAKDSVPQAINCALQSSCFEDAIRSAVSIGGDSDTIAAIAGGIAEAIYGVPRAIAEQGWAFLPKDMRDIVSEYYATVSKG